MKIGLLVLLLCTGCTITRVDCAHGIWHLSRKSFLQKVQVVEIVISTNGSATVKGYGNDGGADAAAKITAAAVSAAMKAAVP